MGGLPFSFSILALEFRLIIVSYSNTICVIFGIIFLASITKKELGFYYFEQANSQNLILGFSITYLVFRTNVWYDNYRLYSLRCYFTWREMAVRFARRVLHSSDYIDLSLFLREILWKEVCAYADHQWLNRSDFTVCDFLQSGLRSWEAWFQGTKITAPTWQVKRLFLPIFQANRHR